MKVTKRDDGKKEEKFIRNLHKGDFFGEKALQGSVHRTYTVHSTATCARNFKGKKKCYPTSTGTTRGATPLVIISDGVAEIWFVGKERKKKTPQQC